MGIDTSFCSATPTLNFMGFVAFERKSLNKPAAGRKSVTYAINFLYNCRKSQNWKTKQGKKHTIEVYIKFTTL